MSSFLDGTGLGHLIEKIKATFIAKTDTTVATSIGIDSTPTTNSTNLVTSGGVKSALDNKANSSDLSTVATTGSYNDLLNKPTIPDDSNLVHKTGDETIYQKKTFAANGEIHLASSWRQIYNDDDDESLQAALNARNNAQADWNQTTTTAADYIKNKPTIPAAQIQADWNQTTTTSLDYIKNKPDIVQSNSPFKQITISGFSNTIVVGDTASIGRNNSKIEIGSKGSDNDTIRLTTSGSDGGVYVSTDTQKFYYNNKEVATKNDIPTTSITLTEDDPNPVSGGAVYDVVVENEQIIAAALNDLNERIDDIPELPENIVTGASTAYTIWCGTQAEYNALQTYDNNTVYLIKETV